MLGSRKLTIASFQPVFDQPEALLARHRGPLRFRLEVSMNDAQIAMGDDFGEAFASLLRSWGSTERRALPG